MKNDKNDKVVGVKLVVFQLGVDLFAADVLAVDRVLRYSPPNSVPDVPKWVEGVTEHRGEVIPVIDLRRRIELAETTITPETRTLVLNTSSGRVGAIVDAVLEVAVVPAESMSPPPALFKGVATDVLRAVTKVRDQLVVVLDVDRVMWNADRIVVEHGAQSWDQDGVGGGGA
jgi:purine-binding chemotaxis protein CheW